MGERLPVRWKVSRRPALKEETLKHISKLAKALFALLLFSPVFGQEIDPRVLETWESAWNRIVDNALDGYLEREANVALSHVDDAVRDSVLEDLGNLLYPALSWDSFGDSVVEGIVSECGEGLLTEMTPWIVGDRSISEYDPAVAQSYTDCIQAMVAGAMERMSTVFDGKRSEIFAIYRTHGTWHPSDPVQQLEQLYVSYPESVDPQCRDGSAKLFDECGDQVELFRTALARANAEGKVLLVEIGAEWCIWCHVFDAHINGDRERFRYTYGVPEEPDARYTRVFTEGEDSSVETADTLRDFVAEHFVVVHIDIQYAPRGYEVMEVSKALDSYSEFIPFVYTVDAAGNLARHFVQETAERRRDSGDWYRGYDRAGMLEQLKGMYDAARAEH